MVQCGYELKTGDFNAPKINVRSIRGGILGLSKYEVWEVPFYFHVLPRRNKVAVYLHELSKLEEVKYIFGKVEEKFPDLNVKLYLVGGGSVRDDNNPDGEM